MAQQPMYAAIPNSPVTELAAAIDAAATSFDVVNGNALPAAPNLATIGEGDNPETILYTGKSGNTLTGVTRGFNGTMAQAWAASVAVARYFTAYDHDAFRQNIADHETRIAGAESTLNAATSAATPNTIVQRDANGRFKAAAPSAADDVARKAEVDAVQSDVGGKVSKSGDTMTGNLTIQRVLPLIILQNMDDSQGAFTGTSHRSSSGAPVFTVGLSPINQRWGIYDHVLGGTSFYIQAGSGSDDLRYKNQPVWQGYNSGPFYKGSGSPEGVVTAPPGSIYQNTSGGNGTTLYVKRSGTGNTGWFAVA